MAPPQGASDQRPPVDADAKLHLFVKVRKQTDTLVLDAQRKICNFLGMRIRIVTQAGCTYDLITHNFPVINAVRNNHILQVTDQLIDHRRCLALAGVPGQGQWICKPEHKNGGIGEHIRPEFVAIIAAVHRKIGQKIRPGHRRGRLAGRLGFGGFYGSG